MIGGRPLAPDFRAFQKFQTSFVSVTSLLLDGARLAAPAAGAAAAGAAASFGAAEDAETTLLADAAGAAAFEEAAGAAAAAAAAAANLPPEGPVDPRGVVGGDLVARLAAGAALSLRLAAPWIIGAKPAPW